MGRDSEERALDRGIHPHPGQVVFTVLKCEMKRMCTVRSLQNPFYRGGGEGKREDASPSLSMSQFFRKNGCEGISLSKWGEF